MKKLVSLLLVISMMTAILAACGSPAADPSLAAESDTPVVSESPETAAPSEEPVVEAESAPGGQQCRAGVRFAVPAGGASHADRLGHVDPGH